MHAAVCVAGVCSAASENRWKQVGRPAAVYAGIQVGIWGNKRKGKGKRARDRSKKDVDKEQEKRSRKRAKKRAREGEEQQRAIEKESRRKKR